MEKGKSDVERRKRNTRNKIGLDVYILTIIISSLLFITGLSLGFAISAQKINILDYEITNMRNSLENIELEFLFLDMMSGNISCSYFIGEANRLAVESSELGNRVDLYERTQQWEEPEYLLLKSRYLYSIPHLTLIHCLTDVKCTFRDRNAVLRNQRIAPGPYTHNNWRFVPNVGFSQ